MQQKALVSPYARADVRKRAAAISLDHGRLCSPLQSAQRNAILLVPAVNVVAAGLEGFGAREFATVFQQSLLQLQIGRQHEKQPVEVKQS